MAKSNEDPAILTDLPAVSAKTIQEFLASFSHLSDATRRRRYSTLCAFYHWLIRLNGSYYFTDITLKGDFRPLREYHGPQPPQANQLSVPENADVQPPLEEEGMLDPTQLSLFLEEEHDL